MRAPVDSQYVRDVLPAMLLVGIGAGLSFPALMTLAMSGATARNAGLASGLVNTTAQVGGALGLAVLATLATSQTARLIADGEPLVAALAGGYHFAFGISAALLVAAIVVAATVLQSERAVKLDTAPAHLVE
jgi:MFS family permease